MSQKPRVGVKGTKIGPLLSKAGLRAQDYPRGFMGRADLVLCIGYDLVEWSPVNWNPKRDRRVICIDTTPAESDEFW